MGDCTADGKSLCETYGVSGYPTIKYFKQGGDPKGDSYDGGRTYNDLQKFMKRNSKKPCDPSSLENCNKKDQKFLDEIKEWDEAKIKEEHDKMTAELDAKK